MKARIRAVRGKSPAQQNKRASTEMRSFRIALNTYPRSFTAQRKVSFEAHCRSLFKRLTSGSLRRG